MHLINPEACPPQNPSYSHAPPKSTVAVTALALGARVEIEFVAEGSAKVAPIRRRAACGASSRLVSA